MSVLQVQDLKKTYGKIQALKGVSFEIPKGAVFGILGPNGSGKTTMLSIILDVLNADSGTYSWFGKPASPDLRKHIGSLLETPNFYHYLSAKNNLKITNSISGRGDKAAIDSVLQKVKLYERRNSRFSTYSLGMKQRLAIAAALLGDPQILVLDEPTNGLDPVGIMEIRELIIDLSKKGHTIIMASHLLDEVEKICTHVAILKLGTLVTSGSVEDVLVDEDVVEIGAADIEQLKRALSNYPGITSTTHNAQTMQLHFPKGTASAEEVNRYCFNQGIALQYLAIKKKRLEEKFFELTGN
ncbi:MAG: ABC transporter ATP-binding protein [Chitinophagaceae bacterium]|jgi:ABC-2 type transport system ATP-binding protein|nr:ABC transporter ATP-binding protein [Chitinophagaceae bacterium]